MVIVNVVLVVIVVFVVASVVIVCGGDCGVIGGSGDCCCRRGSSDLVEMLYTKVLPLNKRFFVCSCISYYSGLFWLC